MLIEKLKVLQGRKTQEEFAAELGISQSQLSRIYQGDRRVGIKLARRIRQRYPELAFDLAAFLLNEAAKAPAEDDPQDERQAS